jgi:hypothetical protein
MSYSDYGSYNWQRLNEQKNWEYKPEWEDIEDPTNDEDDSLCHSIIGDLEGFLITSYKGIPSLYYNRIVFDDIGYEKFKNNIWNNIENEDFTPNIIAFEKGNQIVKMLIDKEINLWSVCYIKTEVDEKLSICGYGLGEHWWLNDAGNELDFDIIMKEEEETFDYIEKQPVRHWLREKECLDWCLNLLKI